MALPYASLLPTDREHAGSITNEHSGDTSELIEFGGTSFHLRPLSIDAAGTSTINRNSATASLRARSIRESDSPEPSQESFHSRETRPVSQATFYLAPTSVHDPAARGSWYAEIGAVILSCLALTAAVIILRYEDGKPITQYAFYLSLNTVISILGTVAKSSLTFALAACIGQDKWNWFRMRRSEFLGFQRFDEASRGPLGSLKFLWWLRMRHWTALGAVVMILLLGFDPFLQAIIYYSGELDDDPSYKNAAQIGRADRLNVGTWQIDYGALPSEDPNELFNTSFPLVSITSDYGISTAVYTGLSNAMLASLGQPSPFLCPSGNCTWPIFTSLAVCSACNDLTNDIKKSVGSGYAGELSDMNDDLGYTRYAVPFGTDLHIMNFDGFCSGDPCLEAELMTAKPTADPQQTIGFRNLSTMLLAVGVMHPNNSYGKRETAWENTSISAVECALYFCANAYQAEVRDNTLNETLLGWWMDKEPQSWQPAAASVPNMSSIEEYVASFNGSIYWGGDEPLAVDMTDLQVVIPDDILSLPDGTTLPSNVTRRFNVTQATIGSTIDFLLSMWTGDNGTYNAPNQDMIYYVTDGQYEFNALMMRPLYESGDPQDSFAHMAKSMTNYIRASSNVTEPGRTLRWVTHIRVRWGFVVLPVLLFISACAFTLLSIVETRRLGLPAWKENAMPMMTYGLDGKTRAKLREIEQRGRHGARKMLVKMEDDGDGLELKS